MPDLERYWYADHPLSWLLRPLSWLFCAVAGLRRWAYRRGWLPCYRARVPVIVVGNLTVGGTGKTPLTARLVELLRSDGYRPGIVSRGYGGHSDHWPRPVLPESNPFEVGDEPVLLARTCGCPVVVGPDRAAAVRFLLAQHDCNVVVCDDGLQHYALARDIEIVVIDGERRFGNGACLPAGPLREPVSRLQSVDFVVVNSGPVQVGEYAMTLVGQRAVNLSDADITCSLAAFSDTLVRAVAGIGNPERFFDFLRAHGIRVLALPFPDHHVYRAEELTFPDELPVLLTEKDAVKCHIPSRERFWYVPVRAQLDPEFERRLLLALDRCFAHRAAARL